MYLIYLDEYHLEDPFYLSSLAQRMGHLRQERPSCLFVHGGMGEAERLLEAEGLFPERQEGVLEARTMNEAVLIERALRHVNRRIVGVLTEEGVHAVGFQGSDRGLLRLEKEGFEEERRVVAGRVAWLKALVGKQVVPVVSALVESMEGRVQPASVPAVAMALADGLAIQDLSIVFLTRNNKPGVMEEGKVVPVRSVEALSTEIVPESEALRQIAAAGFPVFLTSAAGLFGGDQQQGTQILA